MAPRLFKCCVPECNDRESKRHRFPGYQKYPKMFEKWLQRIKPHNFQLMSFEEMYSKFYVCESHFRPEDIIESRRGLKLTSIPSVNIPGKY